MGVLYTHMTTKDICPLCSTPNHPAKLRVGTDVIEDTFVFYAVCPICGFSPDEQMEAMII